MANNIAKEPALFFGGLITLVLKHNSVVALPTVFGVATSLPVLILSLSIMFFGMNWKHPKWPGVIQRKEAWAWIAVFVAYTLLMFYQETH